jgi:4-hydroxythreonine-4-phosphate dehydrogenase
MSEKLIKVGITQGDINGIGYELILKTFEDARMLDFCIPVVYGSSKIMAYHRKTLELPSVNTHTIDQANDAGAGRVNVISCGNEEVTVEFSHRTKESEAVATSAVQRAVKDLNAGLIDVLVFAPATEDPFPWVESETGKGKKPLKMLVKDTFRIALATDNVPLAEVASSLTVETLVNQIQTVQASLIHDFMLTSPRIAVLSLNPGAGVTEHLGKEEETIIIPAIKAATEANIMCFGPYPADTFFSTDEYLKFDAVVAMYHDQAIIPFRTITCGEGVLYAAGLPVVVAAPDQGVSFEIAGKNLAAEDAFRNAIYLSIDLCVNRKQDKKIYANPLRKLYFERGSDNEKLDLTKDEI